MKSYINSHEIDYSISPTIGFQTSLKSILLLSFYSHVLLRRMTMFSNLKEYLKSLAIKIHKAKEELKEYQRAHGGSDGGHYHAVSILKEDFRYKHIAYCLLRGTPMEKIETLPKNPDRKIYTPPNMDLVRGIMDEHKENVRACTSGS